MAGLDAFGVQLQRGDGGGPEVFTAIANVTSLKGPEIKRETYDVTAHDSPDEWREFIGGLVEAGEVGLDVNYDPADHDTLIGDFADKTARNYKIVWPTTPVATWSFKAFLSEFSPEAPVDDKLAASLKIKITGKPTIS